MNDGPKSLHTQIVNEAYVLYEALVAMQEPGQNGQAAIEYIQDLKHRAEQAHLMGLKEIFELTEKNLLKLGTVDAPLRRQAICAEVERLPRLASKYLYALDDENVQHQLVSYLINTQWPEPLPLEKAHALASLFKNEKNSANPTGCVEEATTSPSIEQNRFENVNLEWSTVGTFDELELNLPALELEAENDEPAAATELEQIFEETPFEEPEQQIISLEELFEEGALVTHEEVESAEVEELLTPLEEETWPPVEENREPPPVLPMEEEAVTSSQSAASSRLTELANHLIEINDLLSESLNQFVTSSKESDEFFQAIEKYTDTVQSVWETAERLNLKGFQKICTFINDNMFEATSLPESKRIELRELFATWPKLVLGYLENPEQATTILVAHLSASGWLVPLAEQAASQLLSQLAKEAIIPKIVHVSGGKFKIPTSNPQETPESSTDEKSLVEIVIVPGKENSSLPGLSSHKKSLPKPSPPEIITADLVEEEEMFIPTDFQDWENAFLAEKGSNEEKEHWLLMQAWQRDEQESLAEDGKRPEITGPRGSFLPFSHDESNDIVNLFEEISAEEEKDENLLASLALDLLPEESNHFLTSELKSAPEEEIHLATPTTLDLLKAEISEAHRDLSKALNKFIEATDDSPQLLDALEEYNDNIQSIAQASSKMGLTGLPKVCHLVTENMFEFSTHPKAVRRAAQSHLETWPRYVLNYLHTPLTGAQELVTHLLNPIWPLALDEVHAKALLGELTLRSPEPPSDLDQLSLAEETAAEETFSDVPPSTATEEEVRETPSLIKQLTDLEKILVDSFNTLCEAPEGSEALLNAIETYTEAVQTLWSSTQQTELQDLFVFINDSLMTLGGLDKATQKAACEVFTSWPSHVIAYLQDPSTFTNLIKFLQDSHWPASLPESLRPTDAPLAIISPEVKEIIRGQLVELEEELAKNLQDLSGDQPEILLDAVEKYTENVQQLWEAADLAKLEGLQDVCSFINDNVLLLSSQESATREAAKELLQVWPPLVIAYLDAPTEHFSFLINHLQNSQWPAPLDETHAQMLRERLSQPAIQTTTPPPMAFGEPDERATICEQITDLQEKLSENLALLGEAEETGETLLMAVAAYTDNVQTIWELADRLNLVELREVCSFINDNVLTLGTQAKPTRVATCDLLQGWPALIVTYLKNPLQETPNLVAYLQNPSWPAPLEPSLAAILSHQQLPGEEFYLASPEVLQGIHHQITTVAESLSAVLEVCTSMESDHPALLEAIENYTNQVQAIWEAAETAGLVGLQEVCNFINENLMAFGTQEPPAKLMVKPYLEQWPAFVLEYLQAPLSGAQRLVTFMQAQQWPQPLEMEQADQLLTLLMQSSQSPEQITAYESQIQECTEELPTPLTDLSVETGQEISLGNTEALGILIEELQLAKETFATELQNFTSLSNQEAAFTEAVENYNDQVQRLKAATEMLSLKGLEEVCNFVLSNLEVLSQQAPAVRQRAKPVLELWPSLVLAYLNSPTTSVIGLLNHLRETSWANPLSDEQAHELLNLLTQGSTGESELEEAPAYTRPTVASWEDVLLKIPGDVNQEVWQAYLQETPQHASDFSACIQSIIRSPDNAVVKHAQRIAHTLKGSSNIIGIKGIANIAHHLEDTLEYLAQHEVIPPKELTETMVDAADCIEMMVEALVGQGETPPQAQQVLQNVLDWANRIDRGNLNAPPAPRPPPTTTVESKPAAPASQPAPQAQPAAGGEMAAGTSEQVLRVPTKTIDNLMRLVGELSISLGQIQEKLKHVLHSTRSLTEQGLLLQQKTFALESIVDVRGLAGMESRYRRVARNEEEFDPLEFEEYNELHSLTHSFIESIADNRELAMFIRDDLVELESMFIHQQRLSKEFEASIMTTRMVPVNTILAKLHRNVRQTCRTVGKEAELEVSGADILIDSDVLTNLTDPLQHILRNSIDHGLEAPDDRAILGKPPTGRIKLSFYREGNNIVVSCQDDGQGLNYTNIRYTAIQRGLLKENQELSEAELGRLILMSGFSTKSGVTQVSGRGVGMDVVHTNVRQMKGTLDLFSETGKGTTILIKLPMTLVTVHILLVRVGKRIFGVPTNSLEQALAPGIGELQKVGEEMVLKIDKHLYSIKSLSALLKLPDSKDKIDEEENRPIILVHEETGIIAVVVDELIDTHDLVMKSMGQYVKNLRGVAGAAILGDGSVVPVLDLPELLRSPMQTIITAVTEERMPALGATTTVPKIMIVDDALSVRKALASLMENAGFETVLAKDGVEAVELLSQKALPNVMLVDMEMPRMNGLELTTHVRATQNTQKIPIFMITSRTTEKHREQAKAAGVSAYLTKPYQDTELLGLIDQALTGQL